MGQRARVTINRKGGTSVVISDLSGNFQPVTIPMDKVPPEIFINGQQVRLTAINGPINGEEIVFSAMEGKKLRSGHTSYKTSTAGLEGLIAQRAFTVKGRKLANIMTKDQFKQALEQAVKP